MWWCCCQLVGKHSLSVLSESEEGVREPSPCLPWLNVDILLGCWITGRMVAIYDFCVFSWHSSTRALELLVLPVFLFMQQKVRWFCQRIVDRLVSLTVEDPGKTLSTQKARGTPAARMKERCKLWTNGTENIRNGVFRNSFRVYSENLHLLCYSCRYSPSLPNLL